MSVGLDSAVLDGSTVRLGFKGARPPLELSLLWLRDHARDPQSLHPETQQRLVETLGIPEGLTVARVAVAGEGTALEVVWADATPPARFEADFLASLSGEPERLPVERVLWDRQTIATGVPQVPYAGLIGQDAVLLDFLEQVERFGFCFVEGVPATPEATQQVATRVAYIRETIFGGYYDFTANLEHKDTAYTSLAISAHTDGTYSLDAPGYQIFHCLAAECTGGENVLIDGCRLAAELRARAPEDYDTLTRVAVPGQYIDASRGIHLMARRPLLRLDESGELVQVSYNNHDRAPFVLPPAEHARFYRALRHFAALCEEPQLQYRRLLLPGSVLLFDNWRLLHARDAYQGYRRLAGAYLNKEDVLSRLRVLRARATAGG